MSADSPRAMDDVPAALDWPYLQREAVSLVEEAARDKLLLRLVGSTAIRLCSSEAPRILVQTRKIPKDLDFICRREDRRGLRQMFQERGYEVDKDMLVAMEGQRFLFQHRATGLKLDLFVDRLEFCHTLHLRTRLVSHALTIPVEDLLLSKLQIVKLTQGDLIDLRAILCSHAVGVGESAAPRIDAGYVASVLARDWGFWRTATANLARLRGAIRDIGAVTPGDVVAAAVMPGLERLQAAIEAEPKTLAWRIRSGIGEHMQWWQDVDDREGTY